MVLGAFEKESDDSNYFLSRKIFDAFRTPDLISIQQFQSILRKNKQSLLSPLSYKKPNSEDRRKIETSDVTIRGSKVVLNDLEKKLVLKLSEELNLNEILCVGLKQAASKSRSKYGDEKEACRNLFFEENQNLLTSLLSLIQGREDENLPKQIREYVISFTNELISENLIENLSDLIMELKQNDEFIADQKIQIVQCIFFSCYYVQISETAILKLMKVLKNCIEIEKSDENTKKISYTLAMSIITALDTYGLRAHPETGKYDNSLQKKSFISKFENSLYDNDWKENGFQYFICYSWTLFLNSFSKDHGREDEKKIQTSFNLSKKGFSFISKIIDSEIFQEDDYKSFYISILSEIVVHSLENFKKLVEEMLLKEETLFRSSIKLQNSQNVPRDFENLLELISKIYQGYPDLSLMFLDKSNLALTDFLKMCFEFVHTLTNDQKNKIHSSFVPLMNMMTSFASDQQSAFNVFSCFKDYSIPIFSWDFFFNSMQKQKQNDSKLKFDEDVLESILNLIENISEFSPESRTLFLENLKWNIFSSLFGLLSCQFRSRVIGRIFRVFASLSKSTQVATQIWSLLEAIRILETGGNSGIRYQLEQIESQNQVYDETLGFLELIKCLISQGIPNNLGKEYRAPGISPYLTFIKENVFCKFMDRKYRDKEQMWMVASNCLEFFLSILEKYEPHRNDFVDQFITIDGKQILKCKPPGFELMRDMLSKSDLRRIMTMIISKGVHELTTSRLSKGGPYYEKSVLYCLRCIDNVLIKEDAFKYVSTMDSKQNPIIIAPFNEATLIIKIASYLAYSFSSEIRFLSIRILYMMNQIENNLIGIFSAHDEQNIFKSLIIDRLIGANIHHIPESSNDAHSKEMIFENDVRSTIMDFLLLKNSMTYFLCGLNPNKPELSDLLFGENCLQVIVELLDSPNISITHPHFSEKCYQLIYKLCSDSRTSKLVMNYLQRRDFFSQHISRDQKANSLHSLYQKSYILKIVALQIFTGTLREIHRPGVQEIILLLFRKKSSRISKEQYRAQMLEILDSIEIPKPPTEKNPFEEFLDKKTGQCNIKLLHKALIEKYNPEKQKKEINQALEQALNFNKFYSVYKAVESSFDGWKQVIEISLSKCYDMLDKDTKERVLFDLANSLLYKLSTEYLSNPLETAMSEVVLLIITKFREQKETIHNRLPVDQCLTLLEGLLKCILKVSQNTRSNLYVALLNYFQYTNPSNNASSAFMMTHDTSTELQIGNEKYLNQYNIIARVGQDSLDGKSILKATSFATLDAIFVYDKKKKWIHHLINNGILGQLIDSLVSLGDSLQDILKYPDISLNPLYIYENMMSFFIQISSDLEQYGLFFKLNRCKFIDVPLSDDDELRKRYNQLMIPIFRLLCSIFTQQRKSEKVAMNILEFFNSHHKSISNGLKNDDIEQSKLITSLFYMLSSEHSRLLQIHLEKSTKYENQLMNNLIKYSKETEMDHFEICENILSFYRNITENPLNISQPLRILFTSNFSESNSLKVLFNLLENNTNSLSNSLSEQKKTEASLSNLDENLELSKTTGINLTELNQKLNEKIQCNVYIIENSLLLLWRHLNAFLKSQTITSSNKGNENRFSVALNQKESKLLIQQISDLTRLSKINMESIKSDFIDFMIKKIKEFKK